MFFNSFVVRQESSPEGMSPAQRWILNDPDEFNKKPDASDNAATINAATDLTTTHDDSDSTKEDVDEGEVISFLINLIILPPVTPPYGRA